MSWPTYAGGSGNAQSLDWYGATAFDDFSGDSALLSGRVAPSGHVWSTSGTGAASATAGDGAFECADNVYAVLPYGSAIPFLAGAFSLSGSGTRATTCVVLIASQSSGTFLDNILHLQVSPAGWSLEKRVGGGALTPIASGNLNLTVNGSMYAVGMAIDGSTGAVTLYLPDGSVETLGADAQIASLTLDQAVYQLADNAGAFTAQWNAVAVSDSILLGRNRLALGGAATAAEVQDLKGDGITRRQTWRGTSDSGGNFAGTGWHRLITQSSLLTSCLAGTLKVSYTDSGGASQVFVVDVAGFFDATPTLTKRFEAYYVVRLISQARVSRLAGSALIALDINVSQAIVGTRDLSIEWKGVGDLVTPPSSGASAHATETVTLTF